MTDIKNYDEYEIGQWTWYDTLKCCTSPLRGGGHVLVKLTYGLSTEAPFESFCFGHHSPEVLLVQLDCLLLIISTLIKAILLFL